MDTGNKFTDLSVYQNKINSVLKTILKSGDITTSNYGNVGNKVYNEIRGQICSDLKNEAEKGLSSDLIIVSKQKYDKLVASKELLKTEINVLNEKLKTVNVADVTSDGYYLK
jgi:hypothetical protein